MSVVITSLLPFPPIQWWASLLGHQQVQLDVAEHFQKMTYRNRYHITGANGLIKLSIPLARGREQRTPMCSVAIDNNAKWQVQHWRTLVSVYNRSPYFEFYQPSLQPLFDQPCESLIDFNLASIQWLKKQLRSDFNKVVLDRYDADAPPADEDMRRYLKPSLEKKAQTPFPHYYQLFEERNGFLPNLSILDLLFSLGPHTGQWLQQNEYVLLKRMREMRV